MQEELLGERDKWKQGIRLRTFTTETVDEELADNTDGSRSSLHRLRATSKGIVQETCVRKG